MPIGDRRQYPNAPPNTGCASGLARPIDGYCLYEEGNFRFAGAPERMLILRGDPKICAEPEKSGILADYAVIVLQQPRGSTGPD